MGESLNNYRSVKHNKVLWCAARHRFSFFGTVFATMPKHFNTMRQELMQGDQLLGLKARGFEATFGESNCSSMKTV